MFLLNIPKFKFLAYRIFTFATNCSDFILLSLDAYQHVKNNLDDLEDRAGANENDLVFLQGLLDSPAVTQLIKVSI